jgi:hypothetical protein
MTGMVTVCCFYYSIAQAVLNEENKIKYAKDGFYGDCSEAKDHVEQFTRDKECVVVSVLQNLAPATY